jgi:hypothetical protein
MKLRAWMALGCAALVMIVGGCASTSPSGKPRPQDQPLFGTVRDVQLKFSCTPGSFPGGEDVLMEQMRKDAELRVTAKNLNLADSTRKDAESVLMTSFWVTGSGETSLRGSAAQEGWVSAAFTIQYSIRDEGKLRKVYSDTREVRQPTAYKQGNSNRFRALATASDSLMKVYPQALDELMQYFPAAPTGQ